jgi:hypothetical protein
LNASSDGLPWSPADEEYTKEQGDLAIDAGHERATISDQGGPAILDPDDAIFAAYRAAKAAGDHARAASLHALLAPAPGEPPALRLVKP